MPLRARSFPSGKEKGKRPFGRDEGLLKGNLTSNKKGSFYWKEE